MMRRLFSALVSVFFAANAMAADDLSSYEAEAEQVLQRLRGIMMQEMQKAMQIGAKEAIAVCRHLAPEIEAEIEKETGWEVRRTGLRVRNPDNAPNGPERGRLAGFELRAMSGQGPELLRSIALVERNGSQAVHFMQAIPTFDPCLACHGKNIPADVTAAIRALYPEDQATGYEPGDIRGAFSLYKPYDPAKKAEPTSATAEWDRIAALKLPSSVPLEEAGKTGNASDGRTLFAKHCKLCHSPADLAAQYYGPSRRDDEASLCAKLRTHGSTDEARDCDIVAFLKVLANVNFGK